MKQTQYLSLDEVVALHDAIIEQMSLPYTPLLQVNKPESAIARRRNIAHYKGADLVRQAVVLAVGISQAQAFRTGTNAPLTCRQTRSSESTTDLQGDPITLATHLEAIAEVAQGAERAAKIDAFERVLRDHLVAAAA